MPLYSVQNPVTPSQLTQNKLKKIFFNKKDKVITMAYQTHVIWLPFYLSDLTTYQCPLSLLHFSHTAVKLNFNIDIHVVWKPLWGGQKHTPRNTCKTRIP